MQQYVTFDVSKQSSEAMIENEAGKRFVRRNIATNTLATAAFVEQYGENVAMVDVEAGPLSTWLYDELAGAGLPVVSMDSRRGPVGIAGAAEQDRSDRCRRLG